MQYTVVGIDGAHAGGTQQASIQQIPSLSAITPLNASGGNDPLPYAENTSTSLFVVSGGSGKGGWAGTSSTPSVCSDISERIVPIPLNPNTHFFNFSTHAKGMCQIHLTHSGDETYSDQSADLSFPVTTWPVTTFQNYISITGFVGQGTVTPNATFSLPNGKLRYAGADTFDFGLVAPLKISIQNTDICNWTSTNSVIALKDGDCVMNVAWDTFSILNREFDASSRQFTFFTVKTPPTAAQQAATAAAAKAAAAAAKVAAAAAAAKRAADLKACPKLDYYTGLKNEVDGAWQSAMQIGAQIQALNTKSFALGSLYANDPLTIRTKNNLTSSFNQALVTWKVKYNSTLRIFASAPSKCRGLVGQPYQPDAAFLAQYGL